MSGHSTFFRLGLRTTTLLSPSSPQPLAETVEASITETLEVRALRPLILVERRSLPRPDAERRLTEAEQIATGKMNGEKRSGSAVKSFVDEVKCFLISPGGLGLLLIISGLGAVYVVQAARKR